MCTHKITEASSVILWQFGILGHLIFLKTISLRALCTSDGQKTFSLDIYKSFRASPGCTWVAPSGIKSLWFEHSGNVSSDINKLQMVCDALNQRNQRGKRSNTSESSFLWTFWSLNFMPQVSFDTCGWRSAPAQLQNLIWTNNRGYRTLCASVWQDECIFTPKIMPSVAIMDELQRYPIYLWESCNTSIKGIDTISGWVTSREIRTGNPFVQKWSTSLMREQMSLPWILWPNEEKKSPQRWKNSDLLGRSWQRHLNV